MTLLEAAGTGRRIGRVGQNWRNPREIDIKRISVQDLFSDDWIVESEIEKTVTYNSLSTAIIDINLSRVCSTELTHGHFLALAENLGL